jgi:GTPase SAR1 family protein
MIPVMSHDLRFKHPFSCIISGPSGSGKSSFCIRFLQNLDTLCTERNFDGGILWCYGEKNAIPSQQLASIDAVGRVRYHEGVTENVLNEEDRPCLINLDDLSNEVYSKEVCHLFTKGSHHRSISVILIIQNLFHLGRYCRDISLHAKYLVHLKNVRENN